MFENKLEELKEEKNLKSKDISKYLHVHESTYSEWKHSKIPIPTKRLIELADFYHINIDYMIGLSKNKITIDLALKDINKPIGISEYKILSEIPKYLENTLPNLRDMGKRLEKQL